MNDHFSTIRASIQNEPSITATVHLLTISFDPEFDTAEVLRRYGALRTKASGPKAFDDWEFATGTGEEIKAITAFFGLGYWQEKDEIIHSPRTAPAATSACAERRLPATPVPGSPAAIQASVGAG